MPLSVGTRLGPYEIVAPIGAGGMGEVYKARDTRLDRIVAVKVSNERFSERFEREARAIAALNHPNICQLYDVGPVIELFQSFVSKNVSEELALEFHPDPVQVVKQLLCTNTKRIQRDRCVLFCQKTASIFALWIS